MAVKEMVIFDSCVWIGFFCPNDSLHARAVAAFKEKPRQILLPEYVLIEVVNTLLRKLGKSIADKFLVAIRRSEVIHLQSMQVPDLEILMLEYLHSSHKALSMVDYHLLMLSQKHKVVTFDQKLAKLIS